MRGIPLFAIAIILAVPPTAMAQTDLAFAGCLAEVRSRSDVERQGRDCSEVISRKAENPQKVALAYAQRGWTRATLSEAITDFSAALALNPDLEHTLAGRGFAYLNSGQFELALADYTKALLRRPDNVMFRLGHGDTLNSLKRYEEAIADFDLVLAIEPNNEEALNARALSLAHLGRFAEAIEGYDRALVSARRARDRILRNRCEAKAMIGDFAEAIANCEAAIKINSKVAFYWSTKGIVRLKLAQLEEASADFEEALKLAPDSPDALFGRGILRLRAGDRSGGEEDLKRAEAEDPFIRQRMSDQGPLFRP